MFRMMDDSDQIIWRDRCGSQKCEELKVFFLSILIHIFLHIITLSLSEITPYSSRTGLYRQIHPWPPWRHHWNTPGSTLTQHWTTYHKDFNHHYISPNPITTLQLHRHPQYSTHSFTYTLIYIHLHSLHFTSTYYIIPAA